MCGNADTRRVPHTRTRIRPSDLLIVFLAVCCLASPFIPTSTAADSVYETPIVVDQRVQPASVISEPLRASYTFRRSGRSMGNVTWAMSTSDDNGFKLVVSASTAPAMKLSDGTAVSDYSDTLGDWAVQDNQRMFGFSVSGTRSISSFKDGSQWRGFDGPRGIEVARRRGGASEQVSTTVRLASEMRASVPTGARASARVIATAVPNL
jgi:hypothetical protein